MVLLAPKDCKYIWLTNLFDLKTIIPEAPIKLDVYVFITFNIKINVTPREGQAADVITLQIVKVRQQTLLHYRS